MILLAANEIDSCKWNAREMYKRLDDEFMKHTIGAKTNA